MSFRIEEWQVMQAWKNGANIESTSRIHPKWVLTTEPLWNWEDNDYRIANLTADGMRLDQFCLIDEGLLYVDGLVYGIKNLICVCCENPSRIGQCYAVTTKKEKKLRPWTMEEFEKYRDEWFVTGTRSKLKVLHFNREQLIPAWYESSIDYEEFMESFKREDGSPCGVLE